MSLFFKHRKPSLSAANYADEWRRLRDEYADPAIELAKTKQAVVVSAASVIDRLWNGHGGTSWDESCEEDYVAPLREHLVTTEVFSSDECAVIARKLDDLVTIGRKNLQHTADAEGEETVLDSAGAEVDYLVLRVVDWCRHFPEPIPLADEEEYHGHF